MRLHFGIYVRQMTVEPGLRACWFQHADLANDLEDHLLQTHGCILWNTIKDQPSSIT